MHKCKECGHLVTVERDSLLGLLDHITTYIGVQENMKAGFEAHGHTYLPNKQRTLDKWTSWRDKLTALLSKEEGKAGG